MNLLGSEGLRHGHVHVTRHPIPHVDSERVVRTYVPAQARHTGRPRPLVVMFDGQNVFDDEPSYAGGWHLHRAVERLARVRRPAPIVVAIDHGNDRRISELTWVRTHFGEPKLDPLCDWIAERLVPAARAQFAIEEGPGSVVIGGSSMGGLAAMYAHLRRPDALGRVLAMSPSFWVGAGAIFSVAERTARPWSTRVYLDAGQREARGALARDALRMSELLSRRGWRRGDELHVQIDPRGTHSERSWRRRATGALRCVLAT
jgi:enterochelin esterase-like enzyme